MPLNSYLNISAKRVTASCWHNVLTFFVCFFPPTYSVIIINRILCICVAVTQHVLFDFSAGVIGSVIHYPQEFGKMAPEVNAGGYRTL